jgi:hypothetical protein
MNELKNPIINFELLKSASELVQVSIEEIRNKMDRGRFLILTNMIQPIMDPNGVDIVLVDITDITIDVGNLEIKEENDTRFMRISDTDGYQIFKTPYGLLPTDYIPFDKEFPNFDINNISIYDLAKIRIFSAEFDFADLHPDVITDILDDLVVRRPKVSDITKERLSGLISPDWETKGMTDYFEDVDEKFEDEGIMSQLMETTLTLDDMKSIIDISVDDVYDSFINPDINLELINNLPTVKALYQPQKILERVLHCKYHFIARSCIDPRTLSKSSIKAVYKQTGNMHIVYSLVYLYDKLYTTTFNPSPIIIDVSIRTNFARKFGLNDDEFSLL